MTQTPSALAADIPWLDFLFPERALNVLAAISVQIAGCDPRLWFFAAFIAIHLAVHASFTLSLIINVLALPSLLIAYFTAPVWPFFASSKWLRRNAPPGLPNIGTFHAISAMNRAAFIFFVISVIGMPVPFLVTIVYLYFRL